MLAFVFLISRFIKVGPDFLRPKAVVSPNWMDSTDRRVKNESMDYRNWWKVFNDPVMNRFIVMTSFAFILGVVPLLFAFGAGGASQRAIDTVFFGGMLSLMLIAIPFVPVFYIAIQRLSERLRYGKTSSPPIPEMPSSEGKGS
jgi:hypothetical protein